METIRISYPLQPEAITHVTGPQVIAIGEFDGIHLGHQDVIRRAIEIARSKGLPAALMTFHPHPREVLGKEQYSQYITPLSEKLSLLEKTGVDRVYVVTFDEAFSQVRPDQFVHRVLNELRIDSVVVGFDFKFGYRGEGTAETLRELGGRELHVEIVPPFHQDGEKVSSTLVREQLESGGIEKTSQLLGRNYSVCGTVVRGDGRGRTIGFPTANIELSEPYIVPKTGVYAVEVTVRQKRYYGVMNIGYKPTFQTGEHAVTLEVHIFDFDEMIYDEPISVRFNAYLRPERKFGSKDELVDQIHRDAEQAKSLLSAVRHQD